MASLYREKEETDEQSGCLMSNSLKKNTSNLICDDDCKQLMKSINYSIRDKFINERNEILVELTESTADDESMQNVYDDLLSINFWRIYVDFELGDDLYRVTDYYCDWYFNQCCCNRSFYVYLFLVQLLRNVSLTSLCVRWFLIIFLFQLDEMKISRFDLTMYYTCELCSVMMVIGIIYSARIYDDCAQLNRSFSRYLLDEITLLRKLKDVDCGRRREASRRALPASDTAATVVNANADADASANVNDEDGNEIEAPLLSWPKSRDRSAPIEAHIWLADDDDDSDDDCKVNDGAADEHVIQGLYPSAHNRVDLSRLLVRL